MTSTISAKGQVAVPKDVPDRLGLRAGTLVEFEVTDAGVLLRKGQKGTSRAVDRVAGILESTTGTAALIEQMRSPVPPGWRRR